MSSLYAVIVRLTPHACSWIDMGTPSFYAGGLPRGEGCSEHSRRIAHMSLSALRVCNLRMLYCCRLVGRFLVDKCTKLLIILLSFSWIHILTFSCIIAYVPRYTLNK